MCLITVLDLNVFEVFFYNLCAFSNYFADLQIKVVIIFIGITFCIGSLNVF